MGKRQHQKDKMYLTYTEWTTLYGGKKSGSGGSRPSSEEADFKRLPFDHCCLSLQPYSQPCCDRDGNLFDLQPLLLFLKKFRLNPVTGKPMEVRELVQLRFHRSAEDDAYHCPVLFKAFTKNSHIVANGRSGNVYSFEAVDQLNIRAKNWKDLVSDEPFERRDLITLQDPNDLSKFNISTFHHVRNSLRVLGEDEENEKNDPNARLKTINAETRDILAELDREYKPPTTDKPQAEDGSSSKKADRFNAAHYSTGAVAAAFTSTTMQPLTEHEAAVLGDDVVRYARVKTKGYVRLATSHGPLNLELYCDVVPKACDNFLQHCRAGYYDKTLFHRSIRNFMLQGGDPTGKGTGGASVWGKPFEDEFRASLSHAGRGVLSMANAGERNTNGSQFFITYRSCKNLDNKHTIFGRVVGGMDTLSAIERIEVDKRDRPIEDVVLLRAQVFVDPFQEADEQLAKERAEEQARLDQEEARLQVKRKMAQKLTVYRQGVGKYIDPKRATKRREDEEAEDASLKKGKKSKTVNSFGNFSSW